MTREFEHACWIGDKKQMKFRFVRGHLDIFHILFKFVKEKGGYYCQACEYGS